ncbi:MAG: hypothetical protein ABFD25_22445 [Clostridiaceae bacterium]
MPVKAIVTGIVLIIMVCMLVYLIEFFLPLSMKAELDMICRSTLLKMENAGGLSAAEKQNLRFELENRGLTGIIISGTANARQGSMLTLRVEGDYTYNRLVSLFKREDVKLRMVYNKASMSRKVVN